MRVVRYDRCGPPGVLRVDEVPAPSPGPAEVLVEVHAASVDAGEIAFRAGRLRWMSRAGFPRRLGGYFAGRVVEVGAGVSAWQAGDAVWDSCRTSPSGRSPTTSPYPSGAFPVRRRT
ncbi:alcohol dehydrogenase catalytic domain-containing protein [Streptomyces sp. NBC_01515]|uniref:alcohol dehydrogenase catalytic domain-containing protein n=1 Tax=Streptomyces sp. NBC_01515 TaxID=2903890 RepID=UPI00386D39AC